MPSFTPPSEPQASYDNFWGRYPVPVGISVVRRSGHFVNLPIPTNDDLVGIEGTDFFRGGYDYSVTPEVGQALIDDGYDVNMNSGYGYGDYGRDEYGDPR